MASALPLPAECCPSPPCPSSACGAEIDFAALVSQELSLLTQVINVKASPYLAKGDGVTDDTTAFQSAVNDAIIEGKPIVVPAGNYILTAPITLNSTAIDPVIAIIGAPHSVPGLSGGTINSNTGSFLFIQHTGNGFQYHCSVYEVPRIVFKNLSLIGPDTGATATSADGIHIDGNSLGVPFCLFSHVSCRYFKGGAGFYFNAIENSVLKNLEANYNKYGFKTAGYVSNTVWNRPSAEHNLLYGYYLESFNGNTVLSALIQSNEKTGMKIYGGFCNTFTSCWFENNNTTADPLHSGLDLQSDVLLSVQGNMFTGCIWQVSADVVKLSGIPAWKCYNNRFIGGYNHNTPAFVLDANSDATVIEGLCSAGQITDGGTNTRIVFNNAEYTPSRLNESVLFTGGGLSADFADFDVHLYNRAFLGLTISSPNIAFRTGVFPTPPTQRLLLTPTGAIFNGVLGVNAGPAPSAYIHLGAGTAAAGTAPLKMTPGTSLGAVEDGAFEYDGTHLYFSIGAVRHTLI